MVFSVLHYHFSKSLPCPFLLLTLPQRCSYALYPKDSSLLSIYRLFKFRLRLHCLQIVNKRVRLHEYLKMCWTNTSPPTSNLVPAFTLLSRSETTLNRHVHSWPDKTSFPFGSHIFIMFSWRYLSCHHKDMWTMTWKSLSWFSPVTIWREAMPRGGGDISNRFPTNDTKAQSCRANKSP